MPLLNYTGRKTGSHIRFSLLDLDVWRDGFVQASRWHHPHKIRSLRNRQTQTTDTLSTMKLFRGTEIASFEHWFGSLPIAPDGNRLGPLRNAIEVAEHLGQGGEHSCKPKWEPTFSEQPRTSDWSRKICAIDITSQETLRRKWDAKNCFEEDGGIYCKFKI